MFTLAETLSTDTFGAFLPPLTGRTNPQNQQYANFAAEVLRRDFPGQNMDDRWTQVDSYKSTVYVAIKRIMESMAGSTVKLLKRDVKNSTKSLRRKGLDTSEESWSDEWMPLDYRHAASQLFRNVNPLQTFDQFLADYVMMMHLTGKAFVWTRPGERTNKPVEMWLIRTPFIQPVYNMATTEYPTGAWRITMPWPMTFVNPQMGTIIVDNREIVLQREPHPRWWWDGMSPLTAGGYEIDTLAQINAARKNAMERGPTLDTMVSVEGATEGELKKLAVEWQGQFTNQLKGDRIAFTSGNGVKAETIGLAPKEMSFETGYEQMSKFVLSLFAVPHPIVNMDSGSYAALYASLLQFNVLTLGPIAHKISAHLTKHLIAPYWGDDIKLVIELPTQQSPDDKDREIKRNVGILTVNQRLKMDNYPPIGEEGEVPESIYQQSMMQKLQLEMQQKQMEMQQAMQPQVQPGQEGQEQGQPQGEMPQEQPQEQVQGEVPPEQAMVGQSEDGEQPSEFQQKIIAEVLKSLDVNPEEVATQNKGFFLPTHDAACVMVDLTYEARKRIQKFGDMIAPEDLADKGCEDDPHVTVLYGVYDYSMRPGAWMKQVRKVIENNPRFDIEIGQPKAFRASNTGKPYDVIYLEVHGPGLNRLNSELRDKVPVYSTHPIYTPHATIAYVQPGMADKYLQIFGQVKPLKHHCHEVVFSNCFKNKTRIDLMKPKETKMKGIIKKSLHGSRMETFLKGATPNNPSPKPKKVKPAAVQPTAAKPVEPAKVGSLSDIASAATKKPDPTVTPRKQGSASPEKRGTTNSTTGGKPGIDTRPSGGSAGGSGLNPVAKPNKPAGDPSAQTRAESSNEPVVAAQTPKSSPDSLLDFSNEAMYGGEGESPSAMAKPPVDPAKKMADGFEKAREKKLGAKQADIDAAQQSSKVATAQTAATASNQDAVSEGGSDKNPNAPLNQQSQGQVAANQTTPPPIDHTDPKGKTHQTFHGLIPTVQDKPTVRDNEALDEAFGKEPVAKTDAANTKTTKQAKQGELAPDDANADIKKQTTADDVANVYSQYNQNKTPENKDKLLKTLGNLDERYHERFTAKVGLSPEEFEKLKSDIPQKEEEPEVSDAQYSDSVASAAHRDVDKEFADFKAKQQQGQSVKRDNPALDAEFGVNQPPAGSGASDFDRDLGKVNAQKKQSFGEFLKDNPELADNPREAAKAYKESQEKSSQPSFQEFVDANPDMTHDEVVDAYEQQYPQQEAEQPDSNDAGDLTDFIDIPPLEDETKTKPLADKGKKRLGRPSVVDNLIGTASAADISQLKSVNDWGKFITSAVVMGVARKHALGMFSAKSLILHVLGAYAFHLFNQASAQGKSGEVPVAPVSKDQGPPIPVAKPILKPVTGSTAAIRNQQHFQNERARKNYMDSVIEQKRYKQSQGQQPQPKDEVPQNVNEAKTSTTASQPTPPKEEVKKQPTKTVIDSAAEKLNEEPKSSKNETKTEPKQQGLESFGDELKKAKSQSDRNEIMDKVNKHIKEGIESGELKAPNGSPVVHTFTTGQGSIYMVTEDGQTQRFKSYHQNTGGEDSGLRDWHPPGNRMFVDNQQFGIGMGRLKESGKKVKVDTSEDGKAKVVMFDNSTKKWEPAKWSDAYPKAVKNGLIKDGIMESGFSNDPKIGHNLIEWTHSDDSGIHGFHPGSEVKETYNKQQTTGEKPKTELPKEDKKDETKSTAEQLKKEPESAKPDWIKEEHSEGEIKSKPDHPVYDNLEPEKPEIDHPIYSESEKKIPGSYEEFLKVAPKSTNNKNDKDLANRIYDNPERIKSGRYGYDLDSSFHDQFLEAIKGAKFSTNKLAEIADSDGNVTLDDKNTPGLNPKYIGSRIKIGKDRHGRLNPTHFFPKEEKKSLNSYFDNLIEEVLRGN